ncbi:hypothetical protein D3C72_1829400 [compost metagenome]
MWRHKTLVVSNHQVDPVPPGCLDHLLPFFFRHSHRLLYQNMHTGICKGNRHWSMQVVRCTNTDSIDLLVSKNFFIAGVGFTAMCIRHFLRTLNLWIREGYKLYLLIVRIFGYMATLSDGSAADYCYFNFAHI